MSELFEPGDVSVRSSRYFIARAVGRCPHCGNANPLLALCLPPGHEVFEVDEEAPEDSNVGNWSPDSRHVLLFHVYNLCESAQRRLREFAPYFDLAHGEEHGRRWANHCERCGRQLDDNEMFCEPDGAFCPTSDAAAARIHLSPVDEPLEAAAAGYAYEPEFFAAMSRD